MKAGRPQQPLLVRIRVRARAQARARARARASRNSRSWPIYFSLRTVMMSRPTAGLSTCVRVLEFCERLRADCVCKRSPDKLDFSGQHPDRLCLSTHNILYLYLCTLSVEHLRQRGCIRSQRVVPAAAQQRDGHVHRTSTDRLDTGPRGLYRVPARRAHAVGDGDGLGALHPVTFCLTLGHEPDCEPCRPQDCPRGIFSIIASALRSDRVPARLA